jgi:para-aminobenzoate synthetase component 1
VEHNRSIAIFGDLVATDLVAVSIDPKDLDDKGWWAVTQTFEGDFQAFKFASVTKISNFDFKDRLGPNIEITAWRSSMTQDQYQDAVSSVRADVERGWVYQANLCYILSAKIDKPFDPIGLWRLLLKHNPAPYLSALFVNKAESGLAQDVAITSASPELFLSRSGDTIMSSPIKGTATSADQLLEKDRAENVMIVDLIRNDLAKIAVPGTVEVPDLLRLEKHPSLVHLVSDVKGKVSKETSWRDIFAAMSPPGSVSGAPKSSALEVIRRLETAKREIYCGAFGFVNADTKEANLAVGIRTFWQTNKAEQLQLNFGTGAGITWGSDPKGEWAETKLKANNLLRVAAMKNE